MRTRLDSRSRFAALMGALSLVAILVPTTVAADEPFQFSVAAGASDIVRQRQDAGNVGIDFLMPQLGFWKLKPWAGVLSTSDQALWGGAGLYCDWEIASGVRLRPSLGAGFYEDGVGLDLGHTLQFRSQIEVSYRFDSDVRIGVNFGHLSNGGLAVSNAGTEYVNVTYSLPLMRKRPGAPVNAASTVAADPRKGQPQ